MGKKQYVYLANTKKNNAEVSFRAAAAFGIIKTHKKKKRAFFFLFLIFHSYWNCVVASREITLLLFSQNHDDFFPLAQNPEKKSTILPAVTMPCDCVMNITTENYSK